MKIEWNIKKAGGHLRPRLSYCLRLEPFEIKLAVPMVRITSTIPKPPDAWRSHVYPGMEETNENWIPLSFYELCTPSHKSGCLRDSIHLPMRCTGAYPEVKESFLVLRETYEKALMAAYRNSAFEIRDTLDISGETQKTVAPGIVAMQFLACSNG